jgi:hypothetical protein
MVSYIVHILRVSWKLLLLASLLAISTPIATKLQAAPAAPPTGHIDVGGPVGSGAFGRAVYALPNGNIVVTDPLYDHEGVADVGEVRLLDGATGNTINWMRGSQANDQVGEFAQVLSDGNFLVRSPYWDNGAAVDAGAVTWCSGVTGCSDVVSAANSAVGGSNDDQVGDVAAMDLANGKYVIRVQYWDSGSASDVGAARLCSGEGFCTGAIKDTNSLVGVSANDYVGVFVTPLPNGNYVVRSANWDNGLIADAGAVTFCDGTIGCTGQVSALNSLVGSSDTDLVGNAIKVLVNGNFVINSTFWHNGGAGAAGAATFCSATSGCPVGAISSSTSLVGVQIADQVGDKILPLASGNYIVASQYWSNGSSANAGAVTWCDGSVGCTGAVNPSNSLVGSSTDDFVGFSLVLDPNGSYIVSSPFWDDGTTTDAGAVTWCHSDPSLSGCQGPVSASNSLVGGSSGDRVGYLGVFALNGGKYVVTSVDWDDGAVNDVGAVTLCNSSISCIGPVTQYNSLVGSAAGDQIGSNIYPLANGNYVVSSGTWTNMGTAFAGAVTFCSGNNSCAGVTVDATNSLVGSTLADYVGGVYPLKNGNYVVVSTTWDNAGIVDAGAVTWCSGATGCTGSITSLNSLVGSTANDGIGNPVLALSNGNYVVGSAGWDNPATSTGNVGAVTWCNGNTGCVGVISPSKSLVGSTAGDAIGSSGGSDPYPLIELKTGNYLVISLRWNNGSAASAGAVTFCDGATGCVGAVSLSNSLVGSTAMDWIGFNNNSHKFSYRLLNTGHYLIFSPSWDYPFFSTDAGAVSLGSGRMRTAVGQLSLENSVLGAATSGGMDLVYDYDYTHNQLVVGRPADNVVSLFRNPFAEVFIPLALR